jgi:hypothetical protein
MSNLTQTPPQGLQAQVAWCIEWIYQLRDRLGTTGGGGGTPSLTSTYIGYGGLTNLLTGSSDFVYDNSGNFLLNFIGSTYAHITTAGARLGDISTVGNGGVFTIAYNATHLIASITESSSGGEFFYINPNTSTYAFGDGVNGSTPVGKGTSITIKDATQLVKITNVPTYASDALAIAGGLTTGNLYKSTTAGVTNLHIVP